MTVDKLLGRLEGIRQTGPGRWIAKCPAHDDGRASLSIRETEAGMILLHCFAGCGAADVISAIGLEFADLFPPRESFRPDQRHSPIRPNYDAIAAVHALAHEVRTVAMIAEGGNIASAISEDDRDRLAIASDRIHRALAAVAQDPKRGRQDA